jgi:hypothetical protein
VQAIERRLDILVICRGRARVRVRVCVWLAKTVGKNYLELLSALFDQYDSRKFYQNNVLYFSCSLIFDETNIREKNFNDMRTDYLFSTD